MLSPNSSKHQTTGVSVAEEVAPEASEMCLLARRLGP